jgi:RNA polymerase sigma factor (TIGR02999 family)
VSSPDSRDITALLKAFSRGEPNAQEELMPVVYEQLRAQARRCLRTERSNITLQSTALVHEAYLRLVGGAEVEWHDRAHFFALSARIMRRILIDAARARAAVRRGGGAERVDHPSGVDFDQFPSRDSEAAASSLCALDDALESLALLDARRAQVIELRFFGGLTVEETAAALGVSPQTVMRDWRLARAWIARELDAEPV